MARRGVVAMVALAAAAGAAGAQVSTNFDTFTEAFYGSTFVFDGITFSGVNTETVTNPDGQQQTPDDLGQELIIEDSTYIYNDYPDVISPFNTLTFGRAYVNGPNLSLGALSTVTMSVPAPVTQASFDLIYLDEWVWDGIVVTLEAWNGAAMVATQSFTIVGQPEGSRNIVDTKTMTVSGVTFDTLKVHAKLNNLPTTFRALVDDVTFGVVPPPCPGDFNRDRGLAVDDIFAFLSAWFAQGDGSDFNGDRAVDVSDIFAFLSAWFAGCP